MSAIAEANRRGLPVPIDIPMYDPWGGLSFRVVEGWLDKAIELEEEAHETSNGKDKTFSKVPTGRGGA